jgi:hypothetical protein
VRCGRSLADPPDEPVVVKALDESVGRPVELNDGAVSLEPQQLLLERADESLDVPGALRLPGERWARLYAERRKLLLECMRDDLRAMNVPKRGALREFGVLAALGELECLPQALDGREARATQRSTHG